MPSVGMKEWTAGLNLRLDPWKIPPNALTVASNVVVKDGGLVPLKGLGSAETTGLGASTWAWIFKLGATWLGSTSRRYAVQWQNTYLAYVTVGSAPPQFTNGTTTSNLGLAGPTGAATSAAGAAGNITGTSLTWVYTYVDALGQESGPSPVSNATTLSAQKGSLSGITVGPTGTTARKIYRSNNGAYQYAGTISDNVTTTYTDDTKTLELGDAMLTDDAGAAPSLEGLAVGTHRSMLAGWIGSVAYRSNPGTASAWSAGGINLPEPIVCAAGTPLGFLYLTAAKPYLLTGTGIDDSALTPYTNNYGCDASFSLVETDRGFVWWNAKRGLILYTSGGQFIELMRDNYDSTDIAAFSATNMIGLWASGEYLLFHSGGTLRCDLSRLESSGPVFTTSDQAAGSVFRANDGTTYISVGSGVYKWATGSNRTMTVRTAELANPDTRGRLHIRHAQVRYDAAATFQWYQSGVAHGSSSGSLSPVNGERLVFAPPGLWTRGALEIVTADTVHELSLMATPIGVSA